MATKTKKTGSTDPAQPGAAVGENGLLHQTSREEQIRFRAFEIYQQRGGEPGFEVEDWLRAEGEVAI